MRIRFIFGQMIHGLTRNFAMSLAVIIVTFVSLGFVGAAALLQVQINEFKDDWYDKVEVSVYMCPPNSPAVQCASGEATDEQIDNIRTALQSDPLDAYVQELFEETKEEAYQRFLDSDFSSAAGSDYLTADDMPFSFRVKLHDPQQYEIISEVLVGRDGVDVVRDDRQLFEPLFLLMNRATLLAAGLAAVMLVAAALLISTTIKLSAISRQEETEIMRFVGASNWFIQLPFMLEGALASVIGALLASGGLAIFVQYLVQDWFAAQLSFGQFVGIEEVLLITPLLIGLALLISILSSLVSLRKYLRV